MILKILKPAPNIKGTKKYRVGKELIVTDEKYANMLLDEGYAKKIEERDSFMKEIRKARKEQNKQPKEKE